MDTFHPSMFETPNQDVPQEERTLLAIREQRKTRLGGDSDLSSLESPGKYAFTEDDKAISGSNTRHLFKNLYGETLLTFLFFSSDNVKNIQNLIKYLVHKEMGYIVDDQDPTELLIIMRSIFLEYSAHPPLINEDTPDDVRAKLLKKYTAEVTRLNEIVVNQIIPKVVSQLQQYLDYLRDSSQQPPQMDLPKNVNISGEREYRSVTQVLLGGSL